MKTKGEKKSAFLQRDKTFLWFAIHTSTCCCFFSPENSYSRSVVFHNPKTRPRILMMWWNSPFFENTSIFCILLQQNNVCLIVKLRFKESCVTTSLWFSIAFFFFVFLFFRFLFFYKLLSTFKGPCICFKVCAKWL